jgi:tripartite-type tricarboxylate transporter receptor subunit TctC
MNPARSIALLALAALFAACNAYAQYPSKPIRLVVLIAPGGAPDVGARILGPKLAERLGQPIVVENRVGSNGNIAGEYVAKSPPDGYTLLYGADSLVAINPHVYAKMAFDTLKDIVPVSSTTVSQVVISAHPSVPVRNFKEFLDYVRSAKQPPAFASGGNASIHHLVMEALKQQAGIDLTHVPYKSGTPAVAAAIAGDVPFVVAGTSAAPQIKAGKLRAILVSGKERLSYLPDVPTVGEFYPGVSFNNWLGIWAPAGTPEPIVDRLHNEINSSLATADVKDRISGVGGAESWITTREAFSAFIRSEYDRYGKIVRDIGIKID